MIENSTVIHVLGILHLQVPTGTNQFFEWYFYGLGGIGGWVIFLLLALAATIFVFYDSQNRQVKATGWRLGVLLLTTMLLPTMLYRFTVTPLHLGVYQILEAFGEDCPRDIIVQQYPELTEFTDCDQLRRSLPPMTPYGEFVFYLGILGGILAPVLAAGYYISAQTEGEEYEETEIWDVDYVDEDGYVDDAPVGGGEQRRKKRRRKPKIPNAFLLDLDNDIRYDLFEGGTVIGRGRDSDVLLTDPAVSRRHALIKDYYGNFKITDQGSAYGTYLNRKKVRGERVLQNGDVITVGDTDLEFISSI